MQIDNATQAQARQLAWLINLAGEGLPEYIWQDMAQPEQSALDVGSLRASRDEGAFSYRNARLCSQDGEVLGMILAYALPDPYELEDLEDCPEPVRPLLELEAMAPGTWYINALATFPQHQGLGVARALMADSELRAMAAGCSKASLIVASENQGAEKLYRHLGYHQIGQRACIEYPGCLHGGDWLLMVKNLS